MTDEELNQIQVVVREEVTSSEKRILGEIGKFMEEQLLPVIEEKADKTDIDRLERRFDVFSAKVATLDSKVEEIGLTPTVAHELKLKK